MSKESRRILSLLNDPKYRNRLVGDINLVDQDEPAQVGKDQEMQVSLGLHYLFCPTA